MATRKNGREAKKSNVLKDFYFVYSSQLISVSWKIIKKLKDHKILDCNIKLKMLLLIFYAS